MDCEILVNECESAIDILEAFLNIQGIPELLEIKKSKYRHYVFNKHASIASYRFFYMITSRLVCSNDFEFTNIKNNITLLKNMLYNPLFNELSTPDKVDILLKNKFCLDSGFIWKECDPPNDYAF